MLARVDDGTEPVFSSDDGKQPRSWGDLKVGDKILVSLGGVSYYRKDDWVEAEIIEILPDPAVLYKLSTGWLGVAPKLADTRRKK
jgi:hypothetical protein